VAQVTRSRRDWGQDVTWGEENSIVRTTLHVDTY